MIWTEVDQANLNAAGRLYEANSMILGAAQEANYFESRPSTRYKPKLTIDGDQWCALFGDNLQNGVAGFGASPDEAFLDFDKQWFAKLPPKAST